MYKCCLCGSTYDNADAVVKCVNRCGRSRFQDGAFKTKESKYSGEKTVAIYSSDFKFEFDSNSLEDEVNNVCKLLIDNGAPASCVNQMRARTFLKWNEMTKGDKMDALKKLVMTLDLYVNKNLKWKI